jgi:hypothetical protein
MPSPSFTVWGPPLCERHRSEAIAGRLVTSAAAYPSVSIIGPLVKCFDPDQEILRMRFAKPLGPDQLSSFDSSVFGKQWRKKATP